MAEQHLTISDGVRFALGFGLGMVVWVVFWALLGLAYIGGLASYLKG